MNKLRTSVSRRVTHNKPETRYRPACPFRALFLNP